MRSLFLSNNNSCQIWQNYWRPVTIGMFTSESRTLANGNSTFYNREASLVLELLQYVIAILFHCNTNTLILSKFLTNWLWCMYTIQISLTPTSREATLRATSSQSSVALPLFKVILHFIVIVNKTWIFTIGIQVTRFIFLECNFSHKSISWFFNIIKAII